MYDLGWRGDKFTMRNRHCDESFTKEHLDKAVANSHWPELYRDICLEVLTARSSDDRPILLSMVNQKRGNQASKKEFQYEAAWDVEEDYKGVIEEAWNKGRGRGSQC